MDNRILHIDVGSAVTSARAISVSNEGFTSGGYGACVSPPATGGDLTIAIPQAVSAMKENMGDAGGSYTPDKVVVTVSAGGEPRAVCAGVVAGISGESAKRAALLAGATVADLIAVDDGRLDFERISDLRRQEIAMVVMSGGVDEEIFKSGPHQILNIARVLAEGLPQKRVDRGKVPLIYAASADGREKVAEILQDRAEVIWTDNVRPTLEVEQLLPAREAVVGAFVEGVGRDARFAGLGRLGSPDIWPAGYAIAQSVEDYHAETGEDLVVISLESDAVQVFSAVHGVFTRTVTPVQKAQGQNVRRHIPSQDLLASLDDTVANWKVRPVTLPGTWDELAVFLAIYVEAVREAMADHKTSAIELRGVRRQRTISETFQADVVGGETLVKMQKVPRLILTGPLAKALQPAALMYLAIEGAEPLGVTEVLLDKDDVLEAAGALARMGMRRSFAYKLVPLGVVVSPGKNEERVSPKRASLGTGGALEVLPVEPEGMSVIGVDPAQSLVIEMEPSNGKIDLGDGEGHKARREIRPGFRSVHLDGRGKRSRANPGIDDARRWYRGMKVFPDDVVSGWERGR